MAEINRSDLFSDDAINAPKELAKNLMEIVASINAITASSKKSEEQLKTANSASKIAKETEQLTIQEKELIKVQNQISVALAKNSDEYVSYKKGLDAINKSTKEKIATTNAATKAAQDEEGSINALSKANKELIKQRNALSDKTKEGAAKIAELNGKINENTLKIKANVSGMEQQRMNVGNYTQSILQAIPGIGKFTGSTEGMNTALKANPIGAVVGLLIMLKSILGGNAEIADKLSFLFSGLSKATSFLVDKVVSAFKALTDIKSVMLNVALFISDPIGAIKQFGSALFNAAEEGYSAAESADNFVISLAEQEAKIRAVTYEIRALEEALKDKTKTEKERISLANQIADLEIANAKRQEDIAKNILDNEKLILKDRSMSSDEIAKLTKLQSDLDSAVAERKIIEASRATRINKLLALEEKKDTIDIKKQQAEEEKRLKEETNAYMKKAMADSIANKYEEYKKEKELRDKVLDEIGKFTGQELKLNTSFNDSVLAAKQSINKRIEGADQKSFEKRKGDHEKMLEDVLFLYSQFAGAIGNLLDGITANQMQDIELQKRANKDRLEKDLAAAGDNEAWKEKIKLRSAATDERLAAEQLRLKQRQARYDKATALFGAGLNTALAITKAIPNPVLIALSAALGAIQVAAIAAKPIPAFAKGTSSAPGGMALVGELGRELLVSPKGTIGITPDGPTIMNLQKGTEVIPNKDTLNMLAMAGLGRSQNVSSDYSITNELRELQRSIKDGDDRIVKAISNTDIDFISQGSLLYKMKKSQDGNRLKVRKKIM